MGQILIHSDGLVSAPRSRRGGRPLPGPVASVSYPLAPLPCAQELQADLLTGRLDLLEVRDPAQCVGELRDHVPARACSPPRALDEGSAGIREPPGHQFGVGMGRGPPDDARSELPVVLLLPSAEDSLPSSILRPGLGLLDLLRRGSAAAINIREGAHTRGCVYPLPFTRGGTFLSSSSRRRHPLPTTGP